MGEFRFDQFKLFIGEAVRLTLKIVRKIPALRKLG